MFAFGSVKECSIGIRFVIGIAFITFIPFAIPSVSIGTLLASIQNESGCLGTALLDDEKHDRKSGML